MPYIVLFGCQSKRGGRGRVTIIQRLYYQTLILNWSCFINYSFTNNADIFGYFAHFQRTNFVAHILIFFHFVHQSVGLVFSSTETSSARTLSLNENHKMRIGFPSLNQLFQEAGGFQGIGPVSPSLHRIVVAAITQCVIHTL